MEFLEALIGTATHHSLSLQNRRNIREDGRSEMPENTGGENIVIYFCGHDLKGNLVDGSIVPPERLMITSALCPKCIFLKNTSYIKKRETVTWEKLYEDFPEHADKIRLIRAPRVGCLRVFERDAMSDKVSDFQSHIKLEPIRRYAKAFGMANKIPQTQEEFIAYLYEFGYRLNGEMEMLINHTMQLHDNLLKLTVAPVVYVPNRIVEVPDGSTAINHD